MVRRSAGCWTGRCGSGGAGGGHLGEPTEEVEAVLRTHASRRVLAAERGPRRTVYGRRTWVATGLRPRILDGLNDIHASTSCVPPGHQAVAKLPTDVSV